MIEIGALQFVIQSLGLKQVQVAQQVGISQQHLTGIIAGRDKPSFEVATNLVTLLRSRFLEIKGVTIPPEVAEIVKAKLWPPPPDFTPSSTPRGPGRPPKNKPQKGGLETSSQTPLPASTPAAQALQVTPEPAVNERREEQAWTSERSMQSLNDFARAYYAPGLNNAQRRAIIEVVRQRFPEFLMKSEGAIRVKLKRLSGQRAQLRRRGKDDYAQERKARILEAVGPALAWLRQNSTQSKGAYDLRTFGFRRQTLEQILRVPRFMEAATHPETGETPTLEYVERVLREAGWNVDARNEPQDFIQRMLGWRPRYAGDVILADWTGLPIKVEGQVFEVVNRKTGKKESKYKKFGAHLAVDAATNFTWLDETFGDNEQATWPAFLSRLLFTSLQSAPNFLIMDKVSGVVTSLLNADPENRTGIPCMPEVLAWVAAGVRMIVHTPERANAKGHVEVAAKLVKHRELNALTVRNCLARHMRGELATPRKIPSHAEALSVLRKLAGNANTRILTRDGAQIGQRAELWTAADEQARRAERALEPGAQQDWRGVVSRAKCVRVDGRTIRLRFDGVRYAAELQGLDEAGVSRAVRGVAWILPPLPARHLDPEAYQVCLIQEPDQGGLPRFHSLTARVSKKDKYGFDEIRPFLGEGYHALPNTQQDEVARTRDLAATAWAAQVKALKQGTTDEPVSSSSIIIR